MNERTYRLLEYGEIINRVARCSMSEEAAALILEEKPLSDPAAVEELKARVSALLDRMNAGEGEKRESLPGIGPLLPRLNVEGTSLEAEEAYAIGLFVQRGETLKNWIAGNPSNTVFQAPAVLQTLLAEFPDCSAVAVEVFRVFDREGKLRDLPEFRAIRRRIQNLSADLEASVSRYTGNEETRRMLQSTVPSQRDGRTVLAVKANYRGRIRGIVHEVSATGQTLFIELEESVEKNNDILIEQRRLDAEIHRVLREMTSRIACHREALAAFHAGILLLERLRTKARYSRETGGHFALPGSDAANSFAATGTNANSSAVTVSDTANSAVNTSSLVLKQARHPLLGASAVPIDITMAPGIRTVIVTGPNTGGKTVALKTLGLFALMNQCGIALPAAEGTVLPVFDGIYADIGDEQSISQSLSTFSAHMTNIADIAEKAGSNSLVLLDELGSGTDPGEGSAIAMAILDHLIEKRVRLIATTHHGVLKNYGYTHEGVENASMEFDGRTLSPTYRILMGIPGESRAVDIAARNGLSADIIGRARSYIAEERSDVSALITGLKEKHRELNAATESARAEELRLREDRRRADLKELRLRQKEAEIKAGGMGRLHALLSESRKTLENLVREVREGELNREKTVKVKDFLRDLEAAVEAEDAALEAEQQDIDGERRRIEAEAAGDERWGDSNGGMDAAVNGRSRRNNERGGGKGRGGALQEPPVLGPGTEVLAGEQRRRGRIIRQDKKSSGNQGSGGSAPSWIVEIGSLKMSMSEKELIPVRPSAEERKPLISAADLAPAPAARLELSIRGMRLEEALESLRRQIDAAVLGGLHGFAVIHGKGEGILQKGVHDYLKKDPAVADYYFSRPELGGFGRTEVILK
ncbi:endonuclease MutS2 [Spirochaetia bacterium]|nr:endonuclease MutS2 [Spirochaetia bacterium]